MNKKIRIAIIIVLAGVLLFSTYKVISGYMEYKSSEEFYDNVQNKYVKDNLQSDNGDKSDDDEPSGELTELITIEKHSRSVPISVDFEALQKDCPDAVAWLYSPGTPIDYPVMQADDNSYYLHRLMDGSYNSGGSLFMDFANKPDFTDDVTMIYGHNMKDHSKFGTLVDYKDAAYYKEHPFVYLLTPDKNYIVEIFAGCVVPYNSEFYRPNYITTSYFEVFIANAKTRSTFESAVQPTIEDRFLLLSTCSYEYDDARYVVIGRLKEIK